MARGTGWVQIKRSVATRALNTAILGCPVLGGAYFLVQDQDDDPAALKLAVGAGIGLVFAITGWWYRAGTRYYLRGTELRVRGPAPVVVDLAKVRVAHLERNPQADGRYRSRDTLWLKVLDADDHEATIKLGDTWVRGELSADGLTTIADLLDQPSAPESRTQLVEWLRDYAYRPRAEVWPA